MWYYVRPWKIYNLINVVFMLITLNLLKTTTYPDFKLSYMTTVIDSLENINDLEKHKRYVCGEESVEDDLCVIDCRTPKTWLVNICGSSSDVPLSFCGTLTKYKISVAYNNKYVLFFTGLWVSWGVLLHVWLFQSISWRYSSCAREALFMAMVETTREAHFNTQLTSGLLTVHWLQKVRAKCKRGESE